MLTKFKIYDYKNQHSYTVFVFKNQVEMLEHFNENTEYRYSDDVIDLLALVHTSYKILKSGKISKNIGSVYFNTESLNFGMVSHEMLHCSMDFDRLVNKNVDAEYGDGEEDKIKEERLAYLLQHFTNECFSEMVERNIF